MNLPVIDDGAKVRWAKVPDDCAGLLNYAVSWKTTIVDRARVVVAVYNATHGAKALRHLSATYKLRPSTMERLMRGEAKNLKEVEALDWAFQNAVGRVRLAR